MFEISPPGCSKVKSALTAKSVLSQKRIKPILEIFEAFPCHSKPSTNPSQKRRREGKGGSPGLVVMGGES